MKSKDELQSEICELETEVTRLRGELSRLKDEYNGAPSDCKVGEWCEACAFRKALYYSRLKPYESPIPEVLYVCGMHGICKNFTSRGYKEVERWL